jgi:hypothetical protein
MTTLTRQQIAEIVGHDFRKILAFETLQQSVQELTGTTATNVGATTALQDATVITLSPNDTFSQERVLSVGEGMTITDTGPNANVIIGLLYHIILNGGYRLTFNLLSDTNLSLPPLGTLLESTLWGGPYSTDALAAAGGVPLGAPYRAPAGVVKWRQV